MSENKLVDKSQKRVKKKKTKEISKKQKIFLSRSQISRHFHQLKFSFEKKKKLKKKEKTKNTEEPQRTTSSLLLEPHLSTRNKSDHAFKRRGVEEATKKLVI